MFTKAKLLGIGLTFHILINTTVFLSKEVDFIIRIPNSSANIEESISLGHHQQIDVTVLFNSCHTQM